ncbi:NUDIX domain-containing protein [Lactiplantibacillus garii]|uniref:NUDIX domain-containing protein n=1 Tax=Lactiplantibacillus garii TaxID=2306423 RepID=A0A3R8J7G1_9LACO|nr:GrpB family protein [Lactiplantibacillus garii]RRK10300.1 NUDIX domain-containing protein [Lactiplantibacillus garii]
MQTVELVSYQSAWRATASRLLTRLKTTLAANLLASSHVGSTAMPQVLARPTIDLALLVTDAVTVVNQLNLTPVANAPHTYQASLDGVTVHLIILTNEAAYQQYLTFRDYLNAHRTDGRKYTAIRQTAAQDAASYLQTKAAFMASINDKARDWLSTKDQHEHHDRTVRAELVNMCLITNPQTGEVVVENKIDAQWSGLTFPGGHVDRGESQVAAMRREVLEETGLTVNQLKLVGTVTWVENDQGDVSLGTLYTTNDYSGELLAGSYEGAISWHPLSALTPAKMAPGIDAVLKVFTDPHLNEAFWGFDDNQLRVY